MANRIEVEMLAALQYGPQFDCELLSKVEDSQRLLPVEFRGAIVSLRNSGLIESHMKPYDEIHHREQYELLPLGKALLGSLDPTN